MFFFGGFLFPFCSSVVSTFFKVCCSWDCSGLESFFFLQNIARTPKDKKILCRQAEPKNVSLDFLLTFSPTLLGGILLNSGAVVHTSHHDAISEVGQCGKLCLTVKAVIPSVHLRVSLDR